MISEFFGRMFGAQGDPAQPQPAAPQQPSDQERADVKRWTERIKQARDFDANARKRYAKDRKYARGDKGGFAVGLPIAGTYIEIEKSFLYAKDPDLDVQPSDATRAPPMADVLKLARQQAMSDPQTADAVQAAADGARQQAQQQTMQGAMGAIAPMLSGGQPQQPPQAPPQVDPDQMADKAAQAALQQRVKEIASQLMEPYAQRQADARQFASTISSVIPFLWRKAGLKKRAKKQIQSAHTIGVGWIKGTWQERMGQDPVILARLNDLQDNLARLNADRAEEASGEAVDIDALRAQIEQEIAGLQAKVEVPVARGFAVDFVSGEDITVSNAVAELTDYLDAPWISHRIFMTLTDAKAAFPTLWSDGDDCKLKRATMYYQHKPRDPNETSDVGAVSETTAEDADRYRSGTPGVQDGKGNACVCIHEVWSKDLNQVLTFVDGLDCYAKPPFAPNPGTTRFYPFFLYAPIECDGERHPQSKIERSQSLLDDMNRMYSNRSTYRTRTLPKTVFDATNLEAIDAQKIERGGTQEMVGVKPMQPGTPVGKIVQPLQYARFDPALYDDGPTRAMLEMVWGIQEALSSSIQVAKTATEAQIQDKGSDVRINYQRETLDAMLDDLAEYTTEIALQKMSREDVMRIAGPWAFWPEALKIEDLSTLVLVRIKGGSSGKPNTAQDQQAWAQTLPVLQNAVLQIGQFRQSPPESIADSLEELVAETLRRNGDTTLDPDSFLPSAPDSGAAPTMPNQPPQQAAPMPQGATLQ